MSGFVHVCMCTILDLAIHPYPPPLFFKNEIVIYMILSKIEVHAYKLRTECGVRLNSMVNKVEYLYHRHALFSLHGATSRPRMKRLARSFF